MNKIKVDWTELQYDIFIIKCLSIFFLFFLLFPCNKKSKQFVIFLFYFFFFVEQILMTADNESHLSYYGNCELDVSF